MYFISDKWEKLYFFKMSDEHIFVMWKCIKL